MKQPCFNQKLLAIASQSIWILKIDVGVFLDLIENKKTPTGSW